MASPFKNPETGIYYLRKVIPKELRSKFSGKSEIKKSLKTKDPKKVKQLFLIELQKAEQMIAEAQSGNVNYTVQQSMSLAGVWLKGALEEDYNYRKTEGEPEGDNSSDPYEIEIENISDARTVEAKELIVLDDIRATLEGIGRVVPDKPSQGYKNLLKSFLQAKHEYYRVLKQRALGNWAKVNLEIKYPEFEQAIPKAPPKATSKGISLSDLLKKYLGEGLITEKTAADYQGTVNDFEKAVGKILAEEITVDHIRAYRDHLVSIGNDLAPATKTRKIGAIKSLLSYAIDLGLFNDNPASNIRIRSKDNGLSSKLPFTPADLAKIFSSEVFTQSYRPKAAGGEAAYWLPYLALYTGARLEEMGQLHLDDIQDFEGVHYIEFTTQWDDKDSTRNLKTKAGRRIAPIHPRLVELGFIKYVEKQRKANRKRLFSSLKPNPYGDYTQNWSKWFNQRYLRETLGITDKRKTFHSFRHTFIGTCRAAGMPEDIQNSIVGHSSDKKVSLGYGRWESPRGGAYPYDPKVLSRALDKVQLIIKPE